MAIPSRSASHWYYPDGTPCYEVPNATKGGVRPATLKDARKLGLLPSVTTLQAEINKEMLNTWRVEQGIIAALNNPQPLPGETREDHILRVARIAESIVDDARNVGTLIHAACERFFSYSEKTTDPTIAPLMAPFYEWATKNVTKVHYVEKSVISRHHGYAGKLDAKLEIMGRGVCITDYKSRKRNKTSGKFIVYAENGEQLVAYREADAESNPRADRCVSLIVSSELTSPDLHIHEWPEEEAARSWEAFRLLAKRWAILKNYTPPVC